MALANAGVVYAAIAVIVIAIGIGVLIGLRKRPRGGTAASAPIARAERVRELPSFRAAVRRRTAALVGVLALAVIAAVIGGVAAARPMASETIQPVNANRDIMLCLDVSGSMSDVDVEVLTVFEQLLDGFQGERIGLTIFNSSPVQVFPLTDDYAFVRTQLASIRSSFDYTDAIPEHWLGTLNGPGASLIGDGLAACAMRFDHQDDQRSRSIILATDNELAGASIVSLDEAAGYAASVGVRVFALNPVQGVSTTLSEELVAAARATGGEAYGLRDTTTVADIIAQVQSQEATELRGQAQVVWTDAPNLWLVVLLVFVLGLTVLLWRVRL